MRSIILKVKGKSDPRVSGHIVAHSGKRWPQWARETLPLCMSNKLLTEERCANDGQESKKTSLEAWQRVFSGGSVSLVLKALGCIKMLVGTFK